MEYFWMGLGVIAVGAFLVFALPQVLMLGSFFCLFASCMLAFHPEVPHNQLLSFGFLVVCPVAFYFGNKVMEYYDKKGIQ